MKKIKLLSAVIALALVFGALTPVSAQARTTSHGQKIPDGLQEAVLNATSRPFAKQGDTYTAEQNGMDFRLNRGGLQSQGMGMDWNISLRGMGRGSQITDVASPEIVQTGKRLEYRRVNITEWYRDTVIGVEQGFTIFESPQGNGKLTLQLDLSTDLEGTLDEDGRGVSFAGAEGQILHYDNLKAYDANGTELDANMTLDPAQVTIQVNDDGAAYPVTIDPLITTEQKGIALDSVANDHFGLAVATYGDTAVIGGGQASQNAAYIFVRSGGIWTQQAKLTGSDVNNEEFGYSVAIYGDTVVVGAPSEQETFSDINQGSVYLFVKPAGGWSDMTETAKLRASDGVANDRFGTSVAIYDDTVLIGSPQSSAFYTAQGAAYIFVRPVSGWVSTNVYTAKLIAADGAQSDIFGYSVALSADTALIGAPYDDIGANANQGSAYVFIKPVSGWMSTFLFAAKLIGSYQTANDHFGMSVALSGDTALVAAPESDMYALFVYVTDVGLAYIYTKPAGGWTGNPSPDVSLTPYDLKENDHFASSVAISGNVALVGASLKTDGCASYVFAKPIGGQWSDGSASISETAKLAPLGRTINNRCGASVALSNSTALVGDTANYTTAFGQGAAYFYPLNTSKDLGVSVFASNPAPTVGDTTLLSAVVTNMGGLPVAGVSVNVPLPAGFTYVTHAATHGTYDQSSGAWDVGTLNAGTSANLTISVTVNDSGTTVFTANSLVSDSNSANNSASLKLTPKIILQSVAAQDGWILESGENTNAGGTMNAAATTLRLGDDATRKQYLSVLSFDSSSLPDNAVVTKVTLKLRQNSITGGGNPVTAFQGFMVDVKKGPFGTAALQTSDFQATANKSLGPFKPALTNGWYVINLTTARAYINKLATLNGLTQIRLRFQLDDNSNAAANFLSLYSGNAGAASRPQLIVEYYVP